MRPTRSDHPEESGPREHGGFEVRVIGGGPAEPSPAREGGGLEIGLQIGTGQAVKPAPAAREASPVHRLEAEQPAERLRARPMSDLEPAAPYVPRGKRKNKPSLTLWTAWMAAGTCTLAVAAVAGIMANRKKIVSETDQAITFTADVSFGTEKTYFLENVAALGQEAETLLTRYVAAKAPEDALPLLRDADRVAARFRMLWQPMGGLSPSAPVQHEVAEFDSRMALILSGTKADFSPFELVFVRDNAGPLKLDWEASMGIGDAQLAELRSSKTVVKNAKVRVRVAPGNFYTPEFSEAGFHSYQLLDRTGDEFVWAFARRGSRVAALLDEELNENSVILEKTTEMKATLRIAGPLHEGVNLFEITEMLHKGWVSP